MVVVYRFACLLYGTKFPESSIAPGTWVHCLTKTGKLLITSHGFEPITWRPIVIIEKLYFQNNSNVNEQQALAGMKPGDVRRQTRVHDTLGMTGWALNSRSTTISCKDVALCSSSHGQRLSDKHTVFVRHTQTMSVRHRQTHGGLGLKRMRVQCSLHR